MISEKLGNLKERFIAAKLAGHKDPNPPAGFGAYVFRSNEQAADLALTLTANWLAELTITDPVGYELDPSDLVEIDRVAAILHDAENEWRDTAFAEYRDDFSSRFHHAAHYLIERLKIEPESGSFEP